MIRHRSRLLPLLALVVVVGCGKQTRPSPFDRSVEGAELVVENRYWSDVTIFVVRGGTRTRLGLVGTNARRRFTLATVVVPPGASVAFMADPVGEAEVYVSPTVSVVAGDRYVWTLAVQLVHSTLVRR